MLLLGVVGKPNVGKSTFFKACTLASAETGNYPFVTIKPNRGIGYVKVKCADEFFNVQCNPREGYCINHNRFVPVEMIDVAGLVPGAYEGKGMGNQFLDDLRQADVLIHVIDSSGSTNEKGEPVQPFSYDPAEDIKFLDQELDMWFYQIFMKVWNRFSRQVSQEHLNPIKAITKQFTGLNASEEQVKECFQELNLSEDIHRWEEKTLMKFVSLLRKKTKPIIVAANKIDVPRSEENVKRLKQLFKDYEIIPISAESELALKEASQKGLIEYIPGENDFKIIRPEKLNEKQLKALEFIKKNVLDKFGSTGVQDVINKAVFDIGKYIYVFPGGVNKLTDQHGNILPDCFLIPKNSTALDFAYKIHSDLGDNFIKAIDVKSKKIVGKDHVLNNGDVIEIVYKK